MFHKTHHVAKGYDSDGTVGMDLVFLANPGDGEINESEHKNYSRIRAEQKPQKNEGLLVGEDVEPVIPEPTRPLLVRLSVQGMVQDGRIPRRMLHPPNTPGLEEGGVSVQKSSGSSSRLRRNLSVDAGATVFFR